jgi:ABC-type uncharacterized transport system permease subunit
MTFSPVDALFLGTAAVYLAACVLFVVYLVARRDDGAHGERVDLAGKLAPRLVALAVAMHAAHIVVSSFASHVCPVEGIHYAMSIVSMLAGTVYVVMRRRYRIDVVGVFVAPLALTFLLASRFVGTGAMGAEPAARIQGAILPFHVAANMLGVALFTLAFASAALYLVVEKRLKQKKLVGIFKRLPPLDALDRAEHRFLLAGFPLLTIGILTGTLWARHVEAGSPADIARAVFGYTSWVLFAAVLLLRAAAGWRGRRAAYGTIAGFGFTVLVLLLYLLRSAVTSGSVALR